jgi:CheY-like chemotaxis protein
MNKMYFYYLGQCSVSKYRVIMVDTGEECIERYMEETNRGNKIHLILLDYKLGGMLGDSVARKIKEYNGTKIILNLLKRNKLLGKERISKFFKYAEHDLPSLENKIQNLTSDVIDLKWKKIDLNNTITL